MEGAIISRPGLLNISSTTGVARGQFVWQGSLYIISDEVLLKVVDVHTGAMIPLGVIQGHAPVAVSTGFVQAALVVRNGAIYTLDKSDVLSGDIVGTSQGGFLIPSAISVTYIDGRFVYIPASGDPAFFSDVGNAASVQATSTFDAEELPDSNTVAFNLRNTLYIGGTDSFELFRNVGADPLPFARLTGARADYGYVGAMVPYADTFCFIGREAGQSVGVYRMLQGRAERISNDTIDTVLGSYSLASLSTAIGGRFKWNGRDILTVTLAADSFGFYLGNWFRLTSLSESTQMRWGGGYVTYLDGVYYSSSGMDFGKLDNVNRDYDRRIPRVIDIAIAHPESLNISGQRVTLDVSQGIGDTGTIGIATSRNNVEYGPMNFRTLASPGDYSQRLIWDEPGGLGIYEGFMGLRIYTTQDVSFHASALSLGIGRNG